MAYSRFDLKYDLGDHIFVVNKYRVSECMVEGYEYADGKVLIIAIDLLTNNVMRIDNDANNHTKYAYSVMSIYTEINKDEQQ